MKMFGLIFEAEKGEIPEKENEDLKVGKKSRLARDSVDDQIDSLMIKYESESIIEDEDVINESIFYRNLKAFLLEQEEVIDPAADEEATTGSEMVSEDEPADDEEPNLDIDMFSSKVARLIMSYQQLLKVETAIFNRAVKFLKDNYDEEHSERFHAILEEQYDIEIDKDFVDSEENPPAPQGLGAYAGGAGGG